MQDKKNIAIGVLVLLIVGILVWTQTRTAKLQVEVKEYAMEPKVSVLVFEDGVAVQKELPLGRALMDLATICSQIPQKTLELASKAQPQ